MYDVVLCELCVYRVYSIFTAPAKSVKCDVQAR